MKRVFFSVFCLFCLVLVLLAPVPAAAEEKEGEEEEVEKVVKTEVEEVIVKPVKMEVGLMGGFQSFDTDTVKMLQLDPNLFEIGDGALYGVRFGYRFTPKFELEFSFRRTEATLRSPERKFLDNDVRIEVSELGCLYNFKADRAWRKKSTSTFILGAIGVVKADPVDPTLSLSHRWFRQVGFGSGARYFFTNHIGARVDARFNFYTSSDFTEWNNANLEINCSLDFIY